MLKFGDVFNNILTVGIILGLGYIIYLKIKERGSGQSIFKGLFSKAGDLVEKVNIKK
jgi:hypothetical protein